MQLFYSPELSSSTLKYTFNREESKHIAKVLRKKEGDKLYITNGKGSLFIAELTLATQSVCQTIILEQKDYPRKDYYLHLAVAPTKMNDRYEWFLEKATEIGIDEITPIICDHSERKVIKPERFQRILQSAMKQSVQYYMPILNPATTLKEFMKQSYKETTTYIAHCDQQHKELLKNAAAPKSNILLLIGPEGDFSTKEITAAIKKKYIPVSLGTTRLRTETAAIVAAHSISFINQ